MRFPPLSRILEPGKPLELSNEHARAVLEIYGPSGVVEVQPGQSDADALAAAKTIRMDWCYGQVRRYREEFSQRKAMGVGTSLPTAELRGWFREYVALRKELGEDEVLTAEMPGLSAVRGVDPIQQELNAMGVSESLTADDALADLQNAPF